METKEIKIKDLVKDNVVIFDSYRAGVFYYNIMTQMEDKYQFQVPIEDIGNATLLSSDKAITYMRWIRKSMADNTLIKIS